jgi:DNA mismatch repair protein MutS
LKDQMTAEDPKMTPMMQQFYNIKQQHPDKILFYRMGDFYEMFGDDAVKAAKVLQIQLTTRNKNKEGAIPLCGVPIHAYEQYLDKLTQAGFKIAICEQTEDPALAKGLVRREVVRIITPGTVVSANLLDENENSFLCAVYLNLKAKRIGIVFCDLSTGEFELGEEDMGAGWSNILEWIHVYRPKEILVPDSTSAKEKPLYQEFIKQCSQMVNNTSLRPVIEHLDKIHFDLKTSTRALQFHFSVSTLAGFGIEDDSTALNAAGAAFHYLKETQQDTLKHIVSIKPIQKENQMLLDESTIRNLELFESSGGSGSQHSLIYLLDRCKTAMGARKLRRWLAGPLRKKSNIENRLDSVQGFLDQDLLTDKIRTDLSKTGDLERIIARISLPIASITDVVRLRESLVPLPELEQLFQQLDNTALFEKTSDFDPLLDLTELLNSYILPNPSKKLKDGGYINTGIDERLDELKTLMKNGKQFIANMEAEEKKQTGISSLKIGYNKVFGYFIEVSNTSKHLVPESYIRKQTLVNNERYVTEKLKELEESILTSEDEAIALELEIFSRLKDRLQSEIPRIRHTAQILAEMDVLSTFAHNAKMHNYSRPEFDDNPNKRSIDIEEGRHPVIEALDMDEPFIPNDLSLDSDDEYILVITGPNMGGKSTYMRQTALIALMAQMGSFIPATKARLPVFDRIFTRVGASDNLTRGQSTFMVEMSEAASILNNATQSSLIILDEIGRGTSTFDGISIAWAIIEYIHRLQSLTLFATHYHELILLESRLEGVRNAKVVVQEEDNNLVFLRKVLKGETNKSYGIQVANLAGLPGDVVKRATELVTELKIAEKQFNQLESMSVDGSSPDPNRLENLQTSFILPEEPWVEELKNFDINNSTPLETMDFLNRLQKKIN